MDDMVLSLQLCPTYDLITEALSDFQCHVILMRRMATREERQRRRGVQAAQDPRHALLQYRVLSSWMSPGDAKGSQGGSTANTISC